LREREKAGELDLYYCDESGFRLEASIPYAWQKRKEQILLHQKEHRPKENKDFQLHCANLSKFCISRNQV
jgi:hypothetical protein